MQKLVLFDIDGTLIYHVGKTPRSVERFDHALRQAYGVDIDFDPSEFNGMVDREMAWKMVRDQGVSRETFLAKFPNYIRAMQRFLVDISADAPLYEAIPDARALVTLLAQKKDVALGLITGNAQTIAWWKLDHTGLRKFFDFGLFGDEADDRSSLAKLVFDKAQKHFGQTFAPNQIVVVGDTIHDIRAGKAIGAATIAVTTGWHGSRTAIAAEKPDIIADSLMEKQVRDFLGV